ncbi:MAG TPA: HEAT repeat domain-containing protein [Flavobacterium sp.]|nr:HEAT repeat domain-containing protein [Flavobacterium sp.]
MFELLENTTKALNNAHPIIQMCIYLSLFLLTTMAILVLYLKNIRDRLKIKARIEATYQKKYESDLLEYLYAGEGENISPDQQKKIDYFSKCAQNPLKRKIIIKTFLRLRNEVSGETADAIQKLYYQTRLIQSATKKLKSKKWDTVARTIKELSQFEIKEAHDEIILLINHPKKEVRNEIQKYLVKLFRFDGLEFLSVIENQLSEWDQIQLIEILNKFDNPDIPDLNKWLASSNESVVSFALKLSKLYNQFNVKDEIIKVLFEHYDPEIRIQAINVVTHLGIYEAVTTLKEDFFNRTLDEQIAIFKMMEEMSMPEDIDFVKDFVNHENFFIRISAMKILNLITVDADNTFKVNEGNAEIIKDLTIVN